MATMRQKLVEQLARSMSMKEDFNSQMVFAEVERRAKSGYFYENEQAWFNGLSNHGQIRFFSDVKKKYEEVSTEWKQTQAMIAEWQKEWDAEELANSALGGVHDNEGVEAAAAWAEQFDKEAALASGNLGVVHSEELEAVEEFLIEDALREGMQMGTMDVLHTELAAAAAEYKEADSELTSWSIVVDEGGPIGYHERVALDRVRAAKIKQINRHNEAERRLIQVALKLAEAL